MPQPLVIGKNITISVLLNCAFPEQISRIMQNLEWYKNAEITLQEKFPHTPSLHFAIDSPAWMRALNYNPLLSTDSNTLMLAHRAHTHKINKNQITHRGLGTLSCWVLLSGFIHMEPCCLDTFVQGEQDLHKNHGYN